jgi:ribosome-binding factor A
MQECLVLFKGPSDVAVEEVHAILRQIVARTLESEDCKALAQYSQLKREIATCAASALESMKEDARKMVLTMVEMERSYLTAEVFREILQQNGRSNESGELIRTLSGRQASLLRSFCPAQAGD